MSGLRQTFSDLLNDLTYVRLGFYNNATGASTLQAGDKAQALGFLNNAMRDAWERPRGKDWVWPWTVQGMANVTLTSGAIPIATLDYPIFFSVWSADPDTVNSTAYFIPATWSVNGIVPP